MGGGDPVGVGGRIRGIYMVKFSCIHVWNSKNNFKNYKNNKKQNQQSGSQLRNNAQGWPLFSTCIHISADTPAHITLANMPTYRNNYLSDTNVLWKFTV